MRRGVQERPRVALLVALALAALLALAVALGSAVAGGEGAEPDVEAATAPGKGVVSDQLVEELQARLGKLEQENAELREELSAIQHISRVRKQRIADLVAQQRQRRRPPRRPQGRRDR